MSENRPKCALCGEPMPEGEEMFNYHWYSGPCPKSPLNTKPPGTDADLIADLRSELAAVTAELAAAIEQNKDLRSECARLSATVDVLWLVHRAAD